MPELHTRRFGALSYDLSAVVTFPGGLPGFENETRFVLVEQPDLAPVVCLQSIDTPELCFLASPVAAFVPGYELNISREDLDRLELDPEDPLQPGPDLLCLAILCAPENGPVTANLLAPVVIHLPTRRAVQAVRTDSRYSHQHAIAEEAAC
jgi:flagellar assembly factor FliW